jgi:hypothetical protein
MGLHFRLFIVLCLLGLSSAAQDTLPRFSIVNRGKDRIIISWTNPFGAQIKQLSIQRSFDSLRNFKTILTLPDPTVPQNGYVDSKATNDHMYYRLYILLDSGNYSFSRSKRPVTDNSIAVVTQPTGVQSRGIIPLESINKAGEHMDRIIYVKKYDTLIGGIPESNLKRFRDSINFTTKDTIYMKSPDTILVRVFVPKELYRPSRFVFTEKDGNIRIALPDARKRKYTLKFFEEDLTEAFEVNQITETVLFLDKSNFHHSGWFSFELYEDGKLKERHKLYVPKDF